MGSNPRVSVNAAGAPPAAGPYVHAVASGDFLFCSGQIALDADTSQLVGHSAAEQAEQVLRNLDMVARARGAALRDAVRCTIYLTAIETFSEVNDVYAKWFGDDPPARVTIGVQALPLNALVEIDAIIALHD